MSGRSKNHTLKGGTSPYSLCMGVPPPRVLSVPSCSLDSICCSYLLQFRVCFSNACNMQSPRPANAFKCQNVKCIQELDTLDKDTLDPQSSNKLNVYRSVKSQFTCEYYLKFLRNQDLRSAVTKLRISSHSLPILGLY